jgi:tetratricopeptide (TPR) repeat protein
MDRAHLEYEQAARWYSAALRARPHFRLWYRDRTTMTLRPIKRFPASPILHANAEDAHMAAGHRLRGRWHRWRADRARAKRRKKGSRLFDKQQWEGAYVNFDFAVIGRSDFGEAYAAVLRAVALQQLGRETAAAADFAKTDARFPDLALLIRLGASKQNLPRGVPGDGPVGEAGVHAELRRRGFMS